MVKRESAPARIWVARRAHLLYESDALTFRSETSLRSPNDMKSLQTILVSALTICTLPACQKLGQWNGDAPMRKSGLWQVTVTRNPGTGSEIFLECFDRTTNLSYPIFDRKRPAECEEWSTKLQHGIISRDAICLGHKFGFKISGDFARRFTVDDWRIRGSNTPNLRNAGDFTRHAEWIYQGVCPREIEAGWDKWEDGGITVVGSIENGAESTALPYTPSKLFVPHVRPPVPDTPPA